MSEKSCSDFVKEMAAAGFDFTFKATDGKDVYFGSASGGVVTTKKQLTAEQLKQRIKSRLSDEQN